MKRLTIATALCTVCVQPAFAASYLCSATQQSQCMNGKQCKQKPIDETVYFIVDLDAKTFEECQVEDCHKRDVLFWSPDGNTVVVSHRDIPRTTRLSLHSGSASDLSSYTQSTLSSVMTAVQNGKCFERIAIPPSALAPPHP